MDTGDIEFLFTGDAEGPAEAALSGNLEAEILKVGHHGSSTSSSAAFINKVSPEVAIICVGADNSYGHPAGETVQRLQNAGAKVYRTDLNGNIVITTDGKSYKVKTQRASITPQPVVQPAPVKTDPQPTPVSISNGKFVGSTKSNKYYYPDCRYAESISPENAIWFIDAADAQAQGYVPCGVCKP
ncbi:Ada metal-binding domain-containing protein [Desulfoscipio gibsoniae]|uniref:Ada metal-binding domain-containing protein n=1 Tax=Desulfoscipio gibsoniae TaxID=102134 RepID=UPI000232C3A0|nr:Ada metal-binding domain-containing protein [Desulfoscipio gibsoniae]